MEEKLSNLNMISKTKKYGDAMHRKINTDKLRDMLREKCRIRVRESRHVKFDNSRQFLEHVKKWLKEILQNELNEIDIDIALEDDILKEIIEEQYQWMIEHYEDSLTADLVFDPMVLKVVCPICQVAEVKFSNQTLRCDCGYQQLYKGTLEEYWGKIQSTLSTHEDKCDTRLNFFMDSNESVLNIMCKNCDFYSTVE